MARVLGQRGAHRTGADGQVAARAKVDAAAADLDDIVVLERLLLDGERIDVGAVGAVEVFNFDFAVAHVQHGMLAADRQVVDHDVVVGTPTQRRAFLGECHLPDDNAIDRNDHLRHCRLPDCKA
jgi:hypothetical protein